jgi:hypothetical protein
MTLLIIFAVLAMFSMPQLAALGLLASVPVALWLIAMLIDDARRG